MLLAAVPATEVAAQTDIQEVSVTAPDGVELKGHADRPRQRRRACIPW